MNQKKTFLFICKISILVLFCSVFLSACFDVTLNDTCNGDNVSCSNSGNSNSGNNGSTSPASTPSSTPGILETWIGPFDQPGYAQEHVELDIISIKNDGSFTGVWLGGFYGSTTYNIGQVSVAGEVVLFSSLSSQVQTDMQNSYGSETAIDANTKVGQWNGLGNAIGTLWPSGYYYVIRNGNQQEGVAYEYQGSVLCTFSLQGDGSLGN